MSLLDKFEINKKADFIEYTVHLSPLQKVKINRCFKKKENFRILIENILLVKTLVKLLLKRKQIEEIEQGK